MFYDLREAYDPLTGVARVIEAQLPFNTSHDALRTQLHGALKTAHGVDPNSWSSDGPWVSGVFPSHVIYQHKGETLKRPYTITHGAAGTEPKVTLGDHKKVHVAYVDSKATEARVLSFEIPPPKAKGSESVIITLPEDAEMVREAIIFDETVKVVESTVTTIPVKLIAPGWGSMAYYSKEVLQRDGPKVFTKGTHMMWNHQTASQEAERPEGDLNDLAAVLTKDAVWKESGPKGPGLYAEAKVFSDYATQVSEKGSHIGVSINAGIKAHEGEAEGRTGRIADAFVRAYSTDFVTKAGAGGAPIVPVAESQRAHQGASVMDDKAQEAMSQENEALKKETGDLKTRLLALESSQNEVVAYATVASILREAEVPFRESLLKRACANPVMKEGKPDAEWVKAIVADFGEGQGRVSGVGTEGAKESRTRTTEETDKRFKEVLGDLGVPTAGLDYAVAGRA